MLRRPIRDKELTAICVFPLVRHRDNASRVMQQRTLPLIVEILPPVALSSSAGAGRVTALNHEIPNATVEFDAFVVALLRELDEVVDRLGSEVSVQLDIEVSEVGRDSRVALVFDLLRLQHVLLVGEKGALGRSVWCHEGGREGSGGFPCGVACGVVRYWAGGIGIGRTAEFGEGGGAWGGGVVVGVGRLCSTSFGDGSFGGEYFCGRAGRREVDVVERICALSFLCRGQRGEALFEVVEATHVPV